MAVSDLDHGVEDHHPAEGHAEEFRGLRAVALHPCEEAPLQAAEFFRMPFRGVVVLNTVVEI